MANPIYGVDISHHNHSGTKRVHDLKKAYKMGYRIVGIKMSEGINWKDPSREKNVELAIDAGMYWFGYHYLLGSMSGAAQAQNFLEAMDPLVAKTDGAGVLPSFLDVEKYGNAGVASQAEIRNNSKAWLDTVEKEEARTPGLYTSMYHWRELTGSPKWVQDYWIFVANYTSYGQPLMVDHADPSRLLLWQKGIIRHPKHFWVPADLPGTEGQIDWDVWMQSPAMLEKLANVMADQPDDQEPDSTTPETIPNQVKAQVQLYGQSYSGWLKR